MTFADSYLKSCWDQWWTQSIYARILTCWLVPFVPLGMLVDLFVIVFGEVDEPNGPL